MKRHPLILTSLFVVALLLAAAPAFAAVGETTAGTPINNNATVDYKVNGIDQTQVPSDGGVDTTFVVDQKVKPVVANAVSGAETLTPGETGSENQWLKFTVTNDGNKDASFKLSYEVTGSTLSTALSGVVIIADTDTSGSYTAAGDGSSDLNGQVVTIARDTTLTYFIVAPDTDAGLLDSEVATYHLIATADDGTGTALDDSTPNTLAGEEVVFTDSSAGTATGDGTYDGKDSDSGTFTVSTATLTVTKSVAITDDGTADTPEELFAIPGAVMEYTINIDNGGGTDATSVILIDAIPGNTTYESFTTCSGTKAWHNGTGWVAVEPATLSDVTQVRCTIATLTAGTNQDVQFRVTID